MVLVDDYDKRTGEHYSLYLETFPIKIYDFDLSTILDTAYDRMIDTWCDSIKCINAKHVFKNLEEGKNIWIIDINGDEYELNRDKLAKGIGKALKRYGKDEMLDFKHRLNSPCFSNVLCDHIIQLAVFGKIVY